MACAKSVFVSLFPTPINPRLQRHEIKLDETNDSVESLKEKSKIVLSVTGDFDAIFLGRRLKSGDKLSECGVKPGMTIFLRPGTCDTTRTQSSDGASGGASPDAILMLRTVQAHAVTKCIYKLRQPKLMKALCQIVPGLEDSRQTIALLSDAELLFSMTSNDEIERTASRFPLLAPALAAIPKAVARVERDTRNAAKGAAKAAHNLGMSDPTTSDIDLAESNLSYSVDALSDDEDGFMAGAPPEAERRTEIITPGQLAAALQAATATLPQSGGASLLPQAPSSGGSGQGASSYITPELMQAAMQQAMQMSAFGLQDPAAPDAAATAGAQPGVAQPPMSLEQAAVTYQNELSQMREMGLMDDAASLQALIRASGDVDAAVTLLFEMMQTD